MARGELPRPLAHDAAKPGVEPDSVGVVLLLWSVWAAGATGRRIVNVVPWPGWVAKLKTGETLARQSGGYGCAAGRGSWRWTGQKVDVRASPVGNGFRSTEASAASWR